MRLRVILSLCLMGIGLFLIWQQRLILQNEDKILGQQKLILAHQAQLSRQENQTQDYVLWLAVRLNGIEKRLGMLPPFPKKGLNR